jgi:hypothetical protein
MSMEVTRYACTLAALRENLDQYGGAILQRVLNVAECDAVMAGMWQTLAHWTQHWDAPIARKKPLTWRSYQDLFPTRHMFMQPYGLGHDQFIWELRQIPILRMYLPRCGVVRPAICWCRLMPPDFS